MPILRSLPAIRPCIVLAALLSFLLLAAGAPAVGAATLQKGIWGPTEIDGVSQFPLYKRLRVTVFQMTVSWASVAPTKPVNPKDPADPAYQWPEDVDRAIFAARRSGITVMLMLTHAPAWANGGRTPEWAPDRPADFAAFARAASRRYPTVRRWMIWGEPSRSNNWKPLVKYPIGDPIPAAAKKTPRRYARLLDAAYGQLKAQRRSNLVIGGNTYTTGEIRPIDWLLNMRLPNGRPPRMDLYGHNPFTMRRPDLDAGQSGSNLVDFSDLGVFDTLIQRHIGRPRHKRVRLFLSEFTVPTGPDREFNFYVNPVVQASWITSAFNVARKVKADTLGWIHLRDEAPISGSEVSNGGLLTYDGKRKPGFYAFMRGGLTKAQRAREARSR